MKVNLLGTIMRKDLKGALLTLPRVYDDRQMVLDGDFNEGDKNPLLLDKQVLAHPIPVQTTLTDRSQHPLSCGFPDKGELRVDVKWRNGKGQILDLVTNRIDGVDTECGPQQRELLGQSQDSAIGARLQAIDNYRSKPRRLRSPHNGIQIRGKGLMRQMSMHIHTMHLF
jgi:hypothetical protein